MKIFVPKNFFINKPFYYTLCKLTLTQTCHLSSVSSLFQCYNTYNIQSHTFCPPAKIVICRFRSVRRCRRFMYLQLLQVIKTTTQQFFKFSNCRLFNMQVSGLIALLRLFVGRKYNPLRGGIDSCEYTNQELFVGTVAFTILLLLLPTTTMYYIVFTLVSQGCLSLVSTYRHCAKWVEPIQEV